MPSGVWKQQRISEPRSQVVFGFCDFEIRLYNQAFFDQSYVDLRQMEKIKASPRYDF